MSGRKADARIPKTLLRSVVRQIAEKTNVESRMIMGRSRVAHVVQARHRVMAALREMGYSASAIGEAMGRDHTTVMYALGMLRREPINRVVAPRVRNEWERIWFVDHPDADSDRGEPCQYPVDPRIYAGSDKFALRGSCGVEGCRNTKQPGRDYCAAHIVSASRDRAKLAAA